MHLELDHLVIRVDDVSESVAFYTSILGLVHEGKDGPFEVLRVTPRLTLLLAPWGTQGNEHYAFALPRASFDAVFARIVEAGIEHGGTFDSIGRSSEPGLENGGRGMGRSIYFFDPSHHLLEIRHYDD